MPGLVGIISRERTADHAVDLAAMLQSMKHEPFYDSGMYLAPEMGIYAGWVAHEISFAAGQPFFDEKRDIALLFSGECFADPETFAELGRDVEHRLAGSDDRDIHQRPAAVDAELERVGMVAVGQGAAGDVE